MKSPAKFILWTMCAVAAAVLAWTYETMVGFPRYVADRWVHRVNRPHTYEWFPLPRVKGKFYYAYIDTNGVETRHGPFWHYLENGQLGTTGSFLEGEPHGTWRQYDANRRVKGEAVFDRGTLLREENYFRPKP